MALWETSLFNSFNMVGRVTCLPSYDFSSWADNYMKKHRKYKLGYFLTQVKTVPFESKNLKRIMNREAATRAVANTSSDTIVFIDKSADVARILRHLWGSAMYIINKDLRDMPYYLCGQLLKVQAKQDYCIGYK